MSTLRNYVLAKYAAREDSKENNNLTLRDAIGASAGVAAGYGLYVPGHRKLNKLYIDKVMRPKGNPMQEMRMEDVDGILARAGYRKADMSNTRYDRPTVNKPNKILKFFGVDDNTVIDNQEKSLFGRVKNDSVDHYEYINDKGNRLHVRKRKPNPMSAKNTSFNAVDDLSKNFAINMRPNDGNYDGSSKEAVDRLFNRTFGSTAHQGINLGAYGNVGLAAHELGHTMEGKFVRNYGQGGRIIGKGAIPLTAAGVLGASLSREDGDTADNIGKGAVGLLTLGNLGTLTSELTASYKGSKFLGKGIKNKAKAFAGVPTYALYTAAPVAAWYGAKKINRYLSGNNNIDNKDK